LYFAKFRKNHSHRLGGYLWMDGQTDEQDATDSFKISVRITHENVYAEQYLYSQVPALAVLRICNKRALHSCKAQETHF